jgi:hypothetical protein
MTKKSHVQRITGIFNVSLNVAAITIESLSHRRDAGLMELSLGIHISFIVFGVLSILQSLSHLHPAKISQSSEGGFDAAESSAPTSSNASACVDDWGTWDDR